MSRPTRFVRAAGARLKQVGGTDAVYLRSQRALHVLNPSARLLFDCLERPLSIDALVTRLTELTDADRQTIESDLRETLPELERQGLIERRE